MPYDRDTILYRRVLSLMDAGYSMEEATRIVAEAERERG